MLRFTNAFLSKANRATSSAAATSSPPDQLVGRQSRVHDLPRCLGARHGQARRAEQAELDEDRGLVPVDMLVGATPGSIHSIAMMWVKRKIISSTIRSTPIVRETDTVSVSGGICGMKSVE